MDRYYHLLEGKNIRWISKIKVEFNSKNKQLLYACYHQETVRGLRLRTDHSTVV